MSWWLLGTLISFGLSIGGMAFRIYYLRSKAERSLEKQLKKTVETNNEINEIQNRPRVDGKQLADRFRMHPD